MKKLGKGCLLVVGLVVVVGIVGAVVGGASRSPSSTTGQTAQTSVLTNGDQPQTAAVAPEATKAPTVFTIGQDVTVGNVRWKVLDVKDEGQTLTPAAGSYTQKATTSGKFVRVRFEIENLNKDQISLFTVELIDAQQRKFEGSTDLKVVMHRPTEESCGLTMLNPNVPRTCQVIYEVPGNATGLMLIAGDLVPMGQETTNISLGL